MRNGRPAAATALPALHANHSNGHSNGQVTFTPVVASAPSPYPMPIANEGSQPILPPRPTGRSFAAAERPRSMLRSWPLLVIVLASVAIVVAVVLMVWPSSSGGDAKRALQPPPAPERMETNPLPPPGAGNSNGADPWGGTNGGGHSQADPQPRHTPDPIPAPANPLGDPDDQLAQMQQQLQNLQVGAGGDVMLAMLEHACTKLKRCPGTDVTVSAMCDSFDMFSRSRAGKQPSCSAAKQCFDAIDQLDCTDDFTQNPQAVLGMVPCANAITSC